MRKYKFLIITSSEIEFSYIQQTFGSVNCLDSFFCEFHTTGDDGLILRTDPGLTFFSYALMKVLQACEFEFLINAGICGSFSEEFPPGTVLRVKSEVFADLGTEDKKDIFDMGLVDREAFPFTDGRLFDNPAGYQHLLSALPGVNAVTVNEVTIRQSTLDLYKNRYAAQIENMEGAAFYYICSREKLQFTEIRAVSNFVGDRDKRNWLFDEPLKNLSAFLGKFTRKTV